MAKILYGVAGEGSGHSSRAKEIISHLQSCGHLIKVLSYDRGYKSLSPYFDVEKIFGLRFAYRHNKVEPLSTFLKNISNIPEAVKSIGEVSKIVDDFKPQIVFSDFEVSPTNKKTFFFPPILRKEILEARTSNRKYILAYLTSQFKNLQKNRRIN